MPLQFDLTETKYWKERRKKSTPEIHRLVVEATGMEVLKRDLGGYDYSFKPSILSRKLAAKMKKDYEDSLKAATHPEETASYKLLLAALPWRVGARFVRGR